MFDDESDLLRMIMGDYDGLDAILDAHKLKEKSKYYTDEELVRELEFSEYGSKVIVKETLANLFNNFYENGRLTESERKIAEGHFVLYNSYIVIKAD